MSMAVLEGIGGRGVVAAIVVAAAVFAVVRFAVIAERDGRATPLAESEWHADGSSFDMLLDLVGSTWLVLLDRRWADLFRPRESQKSLPK